jgi:hypothetical protein
VDPSYVGFPGSGRSSFGMGNVVSEGNAFAADHTFSHIYTSDFFLSNFSST